MQRRDESGWTLVELSVVLGVIAVLVSLAIPSLLSVREHSFDLQVKMELTNSARAASAIEVEMGHYPDAAWLAVSMPELDFGGAAARSIHVLRGPVGAEADAQVLLYARSVTGDWFGLRMVSQGADAGRHTCRGAEGDMTLEACTGVAW